MKNPATILFVFLFVSCSVTKKATERSIDPFQYTSTKNVIAENGVVVSAHPLASAVGVSIMKSGGNAVDAVIATQLALAVVYPGAGNIGGGGFLVARLQNGETVALDYRETAPAAAQRDMYLDQNGSVLSDKSINGHLSSGVPGTIAGLFQSMKYAKLPFKKLIAPAIALAEKGFSVSAREAASLNGIQADLKTYNTTPNAFVKAQWKAGDTLKQPDLATTLKRIRDNGQAGFYEGETAKLIIAEMKRGTGLINEIDLKNYTAKWRPAHQFQYKGYTVVSMPMPSSGGVLLHQMLKMVEDKPLPQWGFLSPQAVQLMAEVERRAYADRAEYMGDADFYEVPVAKLTNDAYLKNRMIDYTPGTAGSSTRVKPGSFKKESTETTHISVIDNEGNAVAVTTT
ncbi:MAG TPA: gamma-glutamyltransferase, partial [Chitinophagaceae bacterium]|nr:gamma-glutamyltransferase [Chitinophagaceae bacterium]